MSLRKSVRSLTDNHSCPTNDWRLPLEDFVSKRIGDAGKYKALPKNIRSYYKKQDELISAYEQIQARDEGSQTIELETNTSSYLYLASILAKISLGVNIVLLIAKTVSVILSGSISIISSLVDSIMDLASGIVIWWTSRAIRKRNRYVYPQGRTKLEPVGIVILAVIMAVSSLQIIKESITRIVSIHSGKKKLPRVDYVVIGISVFTIVTKLALFLVFRRIHNHSIQALAQDHRNDVLTNIVAIVCGYLGSQEMWVIAPVKGLAIIDPVGAIVISIYIIITWIITAYSQVQMLTGYRANPEFLSKITWMCLNHHEKILKVDTVRAFHFGQNFLVEVDIVLPETMTLKESHDIAEPLQHKIENLSEVERAFVHVDYEVEHNPNKEHKNV